MYIGFSLKPKNMNSIRAVTVSTRCLVTDERVDTVLSKIMIGVAKK